MKNCIELLLISWIFLTRVIQLFTKEGNWLTLLTENNTNFRIRSITFNLKSFIKVWKWKNRYLSHLLPDEFKISLCCICLVECTPFQSFDDKSNNCIEYLDEVTVKQSKTMETSNIMKWFRCWPVHDCIYLVWVHLDAIFRNKIA